MVILLFNNILINKMNKKLTYNLNEKINILGPSKCY